MWASHAPRVRLSWYSVRDASQAVVEMLVRFWRFSGKNWVNRVEPWRCAWTGEMMMRKRMAVQKKNECNIFFFVGGR